MYLYSFSQHKHLSDGKKRSDTRLPIKLWLRFTKTCQEFDSDLRWMIRSSVQIRVSALTGCQHTYRCMPCSLMAVRCRLGMSLPLKVCTWLLQIHFNVHLTTNRPWRKKVQCGNELCCNYSASRWMCRCVSLELCSPFQLEVITLQCITG